MRQDHRPLDPEAAAEKEAARLRAREVKIWEHHEGTINFTAKLDALDAKYVYAAATQIAGILHATPEYKKVTIDVLRAKALGIMAHPAVALAMFQGALQQPFFGTAPYAVATGLADAEPETVTASTGEGHATDAASTASTRAGDGTHGSRGGADCDDYEVIDTDSGRIDPDPHHCLGHTCGTITVPVAKLQPRVQIYIHLNTTDGLGGAAALGGAADIEGAGTVGTQTLVDLLDGKQVRITPVIDLNTIPAEHQYRPSRRLKEAIHLTFPKRCAE